MRVVKSAGKTVRIRGTKSGKDAAAITIEAKVKGDRVVLHFGGKNRGIMKDISIHDAQWVGNWLSQLTDRQLHDAFRAANYRPHEIDLLARTVRARANELVSLRPSPRIEIGRND